MDEEKILICAECYQINYESLNIKSFWYLIMLIKAQLVQFKISLSNCQ